MNIEDFIIAPQPPNSQPWQLGNLFTKEIKEKSIVLLYVSDCRGAKFEAESQNFFGIRKKIAQLSNGDFNLEICDLGDLISGKTTQDTQYILQEVLAICFNKKTIPIIIGGSVDLSYAMFSALDFYEKNIRYTHITNTISLSNDGDDVSEKNYLSKILSTKDFTISEFNFLGIQRHLLNPETSKLLKEVDFEVVPLATMMDNTSKTEPYFRRADLVTVNCDAIETFDGAFSLRPQVNGLNKREICAYMKEIGLSQNLKSVGIFNYNIYDANPLHEQLLAQMIWYLLEGIHIQKSHPKERQTETFVIALDSENYTFQRDVFADLWYFGTGEIATCMPCTKEDFEQAKKGNLNKKLVK